MRGETEEDKVEKYLDQIQPEIAYCYNCQPYEAGEPIWVLGARCWLEDLFDEYEVPESVRDEVADSLRCNFCGTQRERFDEIGLKTEAEKEFDRKLKEWNERYKDQFYEFTAFLESYPYLGVKHPLGLIIVENMKKFPKMTISDQDWYRARRITSGKKPEQDDMRAPDPTKVQISEGRYNHFGQSHWYLADTKRAAARETLEKGERMVWIQCVRIHKAEDILDVGVFWYGEHIEGPVIAVGIIYSRVLEKPIERREGWKPEYFLPRFIADSAKLAGFKGIVFKSDHHPDLNLVLFEPNAVQYEFKGEPYIFEIGAGPKDAKSIEGDLGMVDEIEI